MCTILDTKRSSLVTTSVGTLSALQRGFLSYLLPWIRFPGSSQTTLVPIKTFETPDLDCTELLRGLEGHRGKKACFAQATQLKTLAILFFIFKRPETVRLHHDL